MRNETVAIPAPACEVAGQGRQQCTLSTEDRERLILEYLPHVNNIARHISRRLPHSVDLDDLVSLGIVGLIKAVDCFDPARNANLKTYAGHRIPGAILDGLRQLDWAPRQRRRLDKQIDAAIHAATQRLNRTPSQEDVAQQLGISIAEYHRQAAGVQGLNLDSLESASLPGQERPLPPSLTVDEKQWPSNVVERGELGRALEKEISRMSHIERTVLKLYYYEELTVGRIAKIVGRAESGVQYIKAQALRKLRSRLSEPKAQAPATEKIQRMLPLPA